MSKKLELGQLGCAAFGLAAIAALGVAAYVWWLQADEQRRDELSRNSRNFEWIERTEYQNPASSDELSFDDDRLLSKNPRFDPQLIDSRTIGDWQLNASAAVVKLDCPILKPDQDAELLVLRPSYAAAMQAAKGHGTLLFSTNLLDGAAKQFDDGLYAALDLAAFRGELGLSSSAPALVQAIFDKLPAESSARPFLAAALELAGRAVDLPGAQRNTAKTLLAEFDADQVLSKPISFYTWTPELRQVWRFYRFVQRQFAEKELAVPQAIATVLTGDDKLRQQYVAVNGLYARLTNPLECLSVDALIGTNESLAKLAQRHGARQVAVAVFLPSTSRETELFNRVFPLGLPAGSNLMARLIQAIKSGEVDLKPGEKDGWYQYQVYALETLLLPTRGQEEQKLLLTASYKKRLVEAFKAVMTKRRETHARQGAITLNGESHAPPPPLREGEVQPRLRVEPCATYYLRTARAYGFLQNFLLATVGQDRLAKLHGLRQHGQRQPNLAAELESIRQRSYGFYLVACEDIGMKPQFLTDEPVDQQAAKRQALDWLAKSETNPDIACDTRVSVPIFSDAVKTRIWATLGVRLARLDASYARPPKVRPKNDAQAGWKEVEHDQLGEAHYLIPVDEFAEITLPGSASLTREELRAVCDRYQTKEEIVEALGRRR